MIVNKEIRDVINENGMLSKQQVISYIDKNGNIQYLTYEIPKTEWYNWTLAKANDNPDPVYKSWNKKSVVKKWLPYNTAMICSNREHEILCKMINSYPAVNAIYELNKPLTAFIDIETEVDSSGFPVPDKAANRITVISYVVNEKVTVFGIVSLSDLQIQGIQNKIIEHTKGFKTDYVFEYKYYSNEYDMLQDFFFNYVKNIPALTGWNIFGFDWVYLYNRCKNLNLDITSIAPTGKWTTYKPLAGKYTNNIPMHKVIYDYLEIYKKWDRVIEVKENSTLDFVAEAALGITKVKHSLGFTEMLEQEPDNYVFYNAIDAVLVRELDLKLKTSNSFFGLANLTHMELLGAISPVRTLEIVQCEYALKENKVFPVGKKRAEKKDYEGAYVYPTVPGVYRNIFALDFNSLYPTTQRQFNISPDTFIKKDKSYIPKADEIKTVSGAVYKRNEKGILPKILTDFYAKRKAFKKEMMAADDEKAYLEKILEERLKNVS